MARGSASVLLDATVLIAAGSDGVWGAHRLAMGVHQVGCAVLPHTPKGIEVDPVGIVHEVVTEKILLQGVCCVVNVC